MGGQPEPGRDREGLRRGGRAAAAQPPGGLANRANRSNRFTAPNSEKEERNMKKMTHKYVEMWQILKWIVL